MDELQGLTRAELIRVVKATQKQKIAGPEGVWAEHVKVKHPKVKSFDPDRHTREAILGFLEGVTQMSVTTESNGHGDGGASSEQQRLNRKFVLRMAKWLRWRRENTLSGPVRSADSGSGNGVALGEEGGRDAETGDEGASDSDGSEEADSGSEASSDSDSDSESGPGSEADGVGGSLSVPSTSSQSELPWQLVQRTRRHPSFARLYDLPSFSKGWSWVRTPREPNVIGQAEQPPRMFAIDCEMVKTDREESSLVALCVVDETGKAVYKEFIKPKGSVLDYKTAVTGLTAKDLEGVTLTRQNARKALRKLLKTGAILVGHSLYNDLGVLHLDHCNVIDTALVFGYKGLPNALPGLKDLAKALLGLDMRKGEEGHHDSFEDAAVTMKLIQRELARGCTTKPLPPPEIKVAKEDLRKLLCHKIPLGTSESDIKRLFERLAAGPSTPGQGDGAAASLCYESVEGVIGKDQKVLLVFKDARVANSAFKLLQGTEGCDNLGRQTKAVQLPSRKTVIFRKMASHNGMLFGRDKVAERAYKKLEAEAAKKAAQPGGTTPKKKKPTRRGIKKDKDGKPLAPKKKIQKNKPSVGGNKRGAADKQGGAAGTQVEKTKSNNGAKKRGASSTPVQEPKAVKKPKTA